MNTETVSTTEIKRALSAARRAQPDLGKTELATRLVRVGRSRSRGRGRPPADIAGLVGPARTLSGMSVGQIVRAMGGN